MSIEAISNLVSTAVHQAPHGGLIKSPDLFVVRDRSGDHWAFWQPHAWAENLITTIGEDNFIDILPKLDNAALLARAVVRFQRTTDGARVLGYAASVRAAVELEHLRPIRRIRIEIDDARRWPCAYGRKQQRPGRARINEEHLHASN